MEVKTNLYNALYYHNASVFFYRGVMTQVSDLDFEVEFIA